MCLTDVEQGFLPWLMDQVTVQMEKSQLGRTVLDGLLRELVNNHLQVYHELEAPLTSSKPAVQITMEEKPDPAPAPVSYISAFPSILCSFSFQTHLFTFASFFQSY